MSIALCFGFALSLAGQTITHRLHPVQSSGATWIVYFLPLNSAPLKSPSHKRARPTSSCASAASGA